MRALHGPKARGRRLDGLVCHVVLGCACAAACVGALAFAATRSHAFHVALSRRRQEQANNGWLLEQCQSPQFYSSLRHHSTLCDDVALAQADALWLHALRDVIDETRVCGEGEAATCGARVQQALEWIVGRGLWTLLCAGAALAAALTLLVQAQRSAQALQYPLQYPLQNPLQNPLQYPLLRQADWAGAQSAHSAHGAQLDVHYEDASCYLLKTGRA